MIALAFVPCAFSQNCDQRNGFIEGEQSEFKVKHENRRRSTFTDAEVEWDPQAMLDNPRCYNLTNVVLRYAEHNDSQMGNSDLNTINNGDKRNWITAGRETYKSTNVRRPKWVVKVAPCLKYDFQILVMGNDQKADVYYSSLKNLEPADKEAIEKSSYVPQTPKFLSARFSDNKTELKFVASPCVDSYELEIKELSDDDINNDIEVNISSKDKIVTHEQKGLKSCTVYETKLWAKMIQRYSKEPGQTPTFTTKPDDQTSENIKLVNFNYGKNFVSFSLDSPWKPKISCIKKYQFEICSNEDCFESSEGERSEVNPFLETTITMKKELTPCTDYTLEITPLYGNMKVKSKSVPFKLNSSDSSSTCPIIQPKGKSS